MTLNFSAVLPLKELPGVRACFREASHAEVYVRFFILKWMNEVLMEQDTSTKQGNVMSSINELKESVNTKTLHLVLLTLATAGIYPLLWMYKNNGVLQKKTHKPIVSDVYIIWIAVCIGLGGAFSGTGEPVLDLLSSILSFAASVLYIVWAFKARSALRAYAYDEHGFFLKMNALYTFLFSVYHINYCINALPEAKRKALSEPVATLEG